MNTGPQSPERVEAASRGPLPLKAAFRAWSDPEALAHLDEFQRYSGPLYFFVVGAPDPHLDGRIEWNRRFQPMRRRFEAKLACGELVATGFATPITPDTRRRESLPPSTKSWNLTTSVPRRRART